MDLIKLKKGHLHITQQSYQKIINKKSLFLTKLKPESFFSENNGPSKIWRFRLHNAAEQLGGTVPLDKDQKIECVYLHVIYMTVI